MAGKYNDYHQGDDFIYDHHMDDNIRENYTILEGKYLAIVADLKGSENVCKQLDKTYYCAAKLIPYFKREFEKFNESWIEWIALKIDKIRFDLMYEYSKDTLEKSINLLESKGIIKRKHETNGQIKTWYYRINNDKLKQLQENIKI